jgi:hypothetical protein
MLVTSEKYSELILFKTKSPSSFIVQVAITRNRIRINRITPMTAEYFLVSEIWS